MTARTWFRKLFAHPAVPSVRRRRPRVETLEDRLVPASYHVTSLLDDGSPGTLRDAILQANANPGPDTIDFQVSGTITIDESSPLPAFTDAATTTVCGEITLDARDSGTVALVDAGASAAFSGLNLVNSDKASLGGILYNAGTLSLTDCTVSGGRNFYGAGIGNDGTLTLTDCTFSGNVGVLSGGGLYNSGTATLTGCVFSGNSVVGTSGKGGAIYNLGTLTVTDSTLTDNSAVDSGGAIANFGSLSLTNGTLVGNTAGLGGGVRNDGTMTLIHATLTGNAAGAGGGVSSAVSSPPGTTLMNTIVGGNTLADGVTPDDLAGDVSGTSSNNLIGPGGSGGLVNGVNGNIVVASAAALGLGALGDNGGPTQTVALLPGSPAVNAGSSSPTVEVQGDPLAALSDPGFETPALSPGSFAYLPSGSPWTFAGSSGLASNGSAFNNPPAPPAGQLAFLQGGDSSISQVVNLAAGTYVIALSAGQRPGNQQTFQVKVDGAVVATLTPSGAVAFATYATSPFTVTAGAHTIQLVGLNPLGGDNTAFVDQIQILDPSQVGIINPPTTDQRGTARVGPADIGAYEFTDFSPSLVVTTLADEDDGTSDPRFGTGTSLREAINYANAHPGADTITFAVTGTIALGSELPALGDSVTIDGPGEDLLTISGVGGRALAGYYGPSEGPPFRVLTNYGTAVVEGLTLANGMSPQGGAIYNAGSLQLVNSTIRDCIAGDGLADTFWLTPTGYAATGEGAGIYNTGDLQVVNSTIADCTAAQMGGALYNLGTASLVDSTLSNDQTWAPSQAQIGGGIYNEGQLSLTGCTVSDCVSLEGGGIYNGRGALAVTASTFTDDWVSGDGANFVQVAHWLDSIYNTPEYSGGAIYNREGAQATVTDSTFAGNSAFNAGAILNRGVLTVQNSTIAGSTGGTDSGAIMNQGTATLTGVQFSDTVGNSVVTNCNLTGSSDGFQYVQAAVLSLDGCTFTGSNNYYVGGLLNQATASVSGCTFTDNAGQLSGSGGIYNQGTLTMSDSLLVGNTSWDLGGAITNDGQMTVTNSTITGNNSYFGTGGIVNRGTMTVINSTVTGNGTGVPPPYTPATDFIDSGVVGGIENDGSLLLRNSIVGGNGLMIDADPADATPRDISGDVDPASSHNLIGPGGSGGLADGVNGNIVVADAADLGLAPLADNGGPTWTIALLPGSPAIDAGDTANAGSSSLAVPFSDPGFEAPSLLAGSYAYDPTDSAWAFSGSAGLASNDSAFNNPLAPQGRQVAFLQGGGSSISQVVDLAAGTYALAFSAAQRTGNQQTFQVLVDGAVVATVTPSGSQFASYTTSPFAVTAGPHTIQFVGLNPLGGDNTVFLDGPATDQRGPGFARLVGAAVDIGAFEVQEQAPTVACNLAAVTGNEGSPVTNSGTFADAQGNGTVTLTASLGTITRDDATGTWSWSYTPLDGPADPTQVIITATGSGGLTATTSFTLAVNNVAPTAAITGAPASGHSPEGKAITLGSAITDPSPTDTAAGFTYAWSVTRNGAAYASGNAAGFNFTPNDNGTYVVTLTATDKDGGVSQVASATISVDNVAPTAGVSGPADGVRGQARTFILTASDPSSVDQAAGFTFAVTWGDGTSQTVTGPSGTAVSHVYTASGTYNVQVTATDKDGSTSTSATKTDTITAVALETDPSDPSKTALFVGGTTAADTISIKPSDATGTLDVKIGSTDLGNFKPTGHIVVYGQAGDDTIKLQTSVLNHVTVYVSAPALLFGGDGKDTLDASGSNANNVLEGGAGNDTLKAGSGRDLLVGGLGADVLQGNAGDDILVGGTTDYDSSLAALDAVMAEWGRTDADYTTRVKHLSGTLGGGLNSGLLLTASTVHDDAAGDTLTGGAGTDWYFALLSGVNKDALKGQAVGEVVTGL